MNTFLAIICGFMKILDYITRPIFKYVSKGKRKYLPPIKNDILKISATDLAEKIRKKQLSCTQICSAYIQRIKEVNPILNAVVEERFEQALRDAKNIDDYLTKSSLSEEELEKIKPLLGVPVTIKESCSVQGLSFCVGSTKRIGYKAETDGEIVSRLKASGAIPLLVSTTPEICLGWETNNLVTGTTNNPYDTTCITGGSSGGEGALLGSGSSIIGIGSDVAGSIRLPAYYNGVFGHKPSPKIAPTKGHYPYCYDPKFQDFFVIGPMTRYAKDLRLVMNVIVGGKLITELKLNEKVDLSCINVFFMENAVESLVLPTVQEDIRLTICKAVKHLKTNCGSRIMDYKFDEFKDGIEICSSALFSIKDIPYLLKEENLAVEMCKSLTGNSKYSFTLLYFYMIQNVILSVVGGSAVRINELKKSVNERLGQNGILLFPTFTCSAPKHNQTFTKIFSVTYMTFANSLQLPSTQVPCGLDKDGLPIGLQVMAGTNQDRLCLAVAEELEKCFGGWVPPPIENSKDK